MLYGIHLIQADRTLWFSDLSLASFYKQYLGSTGLKSILLTKETK